MESWALELLRKFYERLLSERCERHIMMIRVLCIVLALSSNLLVLIFAWFLFLSLPLRLRLFCSLELSRAVSQEEKYLQRFLGNPALCEKLKSFFNFLDKYSGDPASRTAQHLREEIEALSLDFPEIAKWGFITDLKRHLGKSKARLIRI